MYRDYLKDPRQVTIHLKADSELGGWEGGNPIDVANVTYLEISNESIYLSCTNGYERYVRLSEVLSVTVSPPGQQSAQTLMPKVEASE